MTDDAALYARVDDEAAWHALLHEVREHGGLVVEVPAGIDPPQFSTVTIAVLAPHGELARVEAQLLQVLGPGQAAVMLSDAQRRALLAIPFHALDDVLSAEDLAEDDDDGGDDDGGDDDGGDDDELPPEEEGDGPPPRDLPLWAKWEDMSKAERIRVARYGNADARRMVLKDRDPMLHRMVLNNPGLTPNELVALLRGGAASSALVRAVTERSELVGNITVADALVHSPHTPLDIAVRLVAKIPIESAKRIAKAGNLRAGVVGAARKRVLR